MLNFFLEEIFNDGEILYQNAGFTRLPDDVSMSDCVEFLIQVLTEQDPVIVSQNVPLMVFSLRDRSFQRLIKPALHQRGITLPYFSYINRPIRNEYATGSEIRNHLEQYRIDLNIENNDILYEPDSIKPFAKIIAVFLSQLIFKDEMQFQDQIELFDYLANFSFGWNETDISLERIDFFSPSQNFIIRLQNNLRNYRPAFAKSIIYSYSNAIIAAMKRLLRDLYLNDFLVSRFTIIRRFLRVFSLETNSNIFDALNYLNDLDYIQEQIDDVHNEFESLQYILNIFPGSNIRNFDRRQAYPMLSNEIHTEANNRLTIENFPYYGSFLVGIMYEMNHLIDREEINFLPIQIRQNQFVEEGRNYPRVIEEFEELDENEYDSDDSGNSDDSNNDDEPIVGLAMGFLDMRL